MYDRRKLKNQVISKILIGRELEDLKYSVITPIKITLDSMWGRDSEYVLTRSFLEQIFNILSDTNIDEFSALLTKPNLNMSALGDAIHQIPELHAQVCQGFQEFALGVYFNIAQNGGIGDNIYIQFIDLNGDFIILRVYEYYDDLDSLEIGGYDDFN